MSDVAIDQSPQEERRGSADDYDAVAAAVMETARGRWFLEEFARRNRAAETKTVLAALSGVEARIADAIGQNAPGGERITKALRLIERGAGRVRIIRKVVNEAEPGRSTNRLLRLTADLDNALRFALVALGGQTTAGTAEPQVAECASASAVTVSEGAVEPEKTTISTPFDALSLDLELNEVPAEAPVLRTTIQVVEAEVLSADIASPAAPRENGPIPAAAEAAATLDERPVFATRSAPRKLPTAWTPGLLESMREEDRAVLFA